MRVLIIPDVHLKPWMFQRASELITQQKIDRAVCLMDIADDWHQQFNLDLYIQTYDAALQFASDHPDSLWCYGNHDVCYLWNQRETGYSKIAVYTVCEKLQKLRESLPDENQPAFIHRIDNVLFMHGGLTESFVQVFASGEDFGNPDKVIEEINRFSYSELWNDDSPIWYRPQYYGEVLYMKDDLLQVVGHTPVPDIQRTENLLSCDVFSLNRLREPVGSQKFTVLDTKTWEFTGVR